MCNMCSTSIRLAPIRRVAWARTHRAFPTTSCRLSRRCVHLFHFEPCRRVDKIPSSSLPLTSSGGCWPPPARQRLWQRLRHARWHRRARLHPRCEDPHRLFRLPQLRVCARRLNCTHHATIQVDLALGHVAAIRKAESKCGCVVYNLGTGKGVSVLDMVAVGCLLFTRCVAFLRPSTTCFNLPPNPLTPMLQAFSKACGKQIKYEIVPRRPGDIATCYAGSFLMMWGCGNVGSSTHLYYCRLEQGGAGAQVEGHPHARGGSLLLLPRLPNDCPSHHTHPHLPIPSSRPVPTPGAGKARTPRATSRWQPTRALPHALVLSCEQ